MVTEGRRDEIRRHWRSREGVVDLWRRGEETLDGELRAH